MFLIDILACCQSFINLRLIQLLILKKFSNLSITPRIKVLGYALLILSHFSQISHENEINTIFIGYLKNGSGEES